MKNKEANGSQEPARDPKVISKIYAYIRRHFEGGFLSALQRVRKDHRLLYTIEVDHENTIYRLRFNDKGQPCYIDAEPVMESDDEYLMS